MCVCPEANALRCTAHSGVVKKTLRFFETPAESPGTLQRCSGGGCTDREASGFDDVGIAHNYLTVQSSSVAGSVRSTSFIEERLVQSTVVVHANMYATISKDQVLFLVSGGVLQGRSPSNCTGLPVSSRGRALKACRIDPGRRYADST